MSLIHMEDDIKTLLVDNWNSANTSSKTPNIEIITETPSALLDSNGYIFIYTESRNEDIPGIGLTTQADLRDSIKIDIRIRDRTYFNQVKTEVARILFSNRRNPTSNIDELHLDNLTITPLSDKTKKIYREVRQITGVIYNQNMTA